jgi:DNA-binding MarR family transcriptional regulator
MSSSGSELNHVLKDWIDLFMSRSHHHLVRYLRTTELSLAQFGTLMRLRHGEHCGVGDIANTFSVSNAAASQLVDKLVHLGLVARSEDPNDRRAKRLTITPQGVDLLERSHAARLAWTQAVVAKLSPDQQRAVAAALTKLIAAAQAVPEPEEAARP